MDNKDEALTITNPRLLTAAFYGPLAIVTTIIIEVILYAIGVEKILPTFQSILLAVIIASCFGALFGKRIIYCERPYATKAFWWGFLMVIAAVPIYALIFLYLLNKFHPHVMENFSILNVLVTYLFILFYCYLFAGLWLAILAGLAAIYLRGRLAYDILHSKNERLKSNKEDSKPIEVEKQDLK